MIHHAERKRFRDTRVPDAAKSIAAQWVIKELRRVRVDMLNYYISNWAAQEGPLRTVRSSKYFSAGSKPGRTGTSPFWLASFLELIQTAVSAVTF